MASQITNYFSNAILTNFLVTAPRWVSLHTSDPGAVGDFATELTGGSYARYSITGWTPPGNKTTAINCAPAWVGLPACTITYFGICDAATGGHVLVTVAAASSYVVPAGGSLTVATQDITLTLG